MALPMYYSNVEGVWSNSVLKKRNLKKQNDIFENLRLPSPAGLTPNRCTTNLQLVDITNIKTRKRLGFSITCYITQDDQLS